MNKERKKISIPSTMMILLIFIVFASVLTFIMPAGQFDSHIDEVTGETVTSLEDFHFMESTPVSVLQIPYLLVKAFTSSSTVTIVVTYLFIGGCVGILTSCGAIQRVAGVLIRKLRGKRFLLVFLFTFIFMVLGLTITPHAFVAFVPFSVSFAYSLGYDALVGVAMPMLGSAAAYCPAPLMSTTVLAQSYFGIPSFSGFAYRLICTAAILIVSVLYIYRYGEKVRTKKKESIVPDYEYSGDTGSFDERVGVKDVLAIAFLAATVSVIIWGSRKYGWSTLELSACFLVEGIATSLIYVPSLENAIKDYVRSAQAMLPSAVIAGTASLVCTILTAGGVLDTVIYYSCKILEHSSLGFKAVSMFLVQSIINIFIISGGGQIAATMPLMVPISNICGIPGNTAVLCCTLGDGLSNYILPHSPSLAGFIGAGNIKFTEWVKFFFKLFVIWCLVSAAAVYISTIIW